MTIHYNRVLPDSNYTVDMEKARQLWRADYAKLSDLFSSKIMLPDGKVIFTPTHMMGQAEADVKLIAYNDRDEIFQKDITRFVQPDEIAISIKHHSPSPSDDGKEKIKLQCTHIQIAVGVMAEGKPGVLSVNNPQDYQAGLFGAPNYPMIFIRPIFPSGLSDSQITDYINNIRTWLVIANTFTHFPGDYNGGDPLGTRNVEQVKQLGDNLLDALLGKREALDWLASPLNRVYCAELAHVSLNLGLHYPLNSRFADPQRFEKIKEKIDSKTFVEQNDNSYIHFVSLCTAPEDLEPITEAADIADAEPVPHYSRWFDRNLGVKPFNVPNMLEKYLQFSIPRDELGEEVAAVQAAVLKECQPAVFTALGLKNLPDSDKKKIFAATLYEDIVKCVGTRHESYDSFREAISPLLDKAAEIASPRDDGFGAFIPPHCFLVRAAESIKGRTDIGLLKWQYMGHGLHESILQTGPVTV